MSIIHPFLIKKGGTEPVGTGHRVRFFDYDGTLLKTKYVEDGNNATAPTMPDYSVATADRPALIFQTWNNSIYNITKDIDLGAVYKTYDGKTYLYIELNSITGLSPTLSFNKLNTNIMTIDWGDNTIETNNSSGNITLNHTYANEGSYVIKIGFTGYNVEFKIGHGTSANSLLGSYSSALKGLYVGDNVAIMQNYSCYQCTNLRKLTIPTLCSTIGGYCFSDCYSLPFAITSCYSSLIDASTYYNCYNLNKVIISQQVTIIGGSAFANDFSLNNVILPDNVSSFFHNAFGACRVIDKMVIPASVQSIATLVFNFNVNVRIYILLSTNPPTLSNINSLTGINQLCKIYVPDESVNTYKTATNWTTYADYIYPLSTYEEV